MTALRLLPELEDALRSIFEAYRNDVAEARKLMD